MTDTLKPAELDLEALKKGLAVHLQSLEYAAAPTKSEVFVVCGREAGDLRDAIEALLTRIEALEAERDEAVVSAGLAARDLQYAEAQRDRMREALEADRVTLAWLNRRGGLGYDAHDAIEKRLTDLAALSQGTAGSSGAGE